MKKILYTPFNFWKNLENKNDYYFLAISFTIPQYYNGLRYFKFVPSKELFFDTHKEGYEYEKYFSRYLNEISKLDKNSILKELNEISEKQIVFLGWEKYKVYGEKWSIFKTDVLREFPFPEIKGRLPFQFRKPFL